jgi:hypothetical protein
MKLIDNIYNINSENIESEDLKEETEQNVIHKLTISYHSQVINKIKKIEQTFDNIIPFDSFKNIIQELKNYYDFDNNFHSKLTNCTHNLESKDCTYSTLDYEKENTLYEIYNIIDSDQLTPEENIIFSNIKDNLKERERENYFDIFTDEEINLMVNSRINQSIISRIPNSYKTELMDEFEKLSYVLNNSKLYKNQKTQTTVKNTNLYNLANVSNFNELANKIGICKLCDSQLSNFYFQFYPVTIKNKEDFFKTKEIFFESIMLDLCSYRDNKNKYIESKLEEIKKTDDLDLIKSNIDKIEALSFIK